MKKLELLFSIIVLAGGICLAQTTGFTYQGKLADAGAPATGPYDLTFKLFPIISGGAQIGADVVRDDVQVTNGVFTVSLDFGSSPFTSDTARYLEIAVRPGASTGAYTTLVPRQPITSSPYSVSTIRAASADVATNALQLGGVAASQFVQTGDTRLTDARTPTAGSANYIQNTTSTQPSSNFNISGNGTVGGTFTSNISNATRYDINGSRVITEPTISSIFVGRFAGSLTAFANSNSFFGSFAGSQTTSGGENTFVGAGAAELNTAGSFNAFFGAGSGKANTTGRFNTIIGREANVGSGALEFATALGAGAVVSTSNTVALGRGIDTVQIPGSLNVAGNLTGNFTVPAGNITGILSPANGGSGLNSPGASGNFLRSNGTSWTSSLLQASDIPSGSTNYIQNIPGIGQQSASFNITGGGTANIFNAATQYNIGGNRVLSNSGQGNLFAGRDAGTSHTTGFTNSFFGAQSGQLNTTGGANSFFGFGAGQSNTTSFNNSFFGTTSGQSNTSGEDNSFFGAYSGGVNTDGTFNSFFGADAGAANTEGSLNSFFGGRAGGSNIVGGFNSFFGQSAGFTNTTGSNNTMLGYAANVGSGNLSNATAIGANSVVSQSNSLVLGNNANVGIGTTAPARKFHIVGTGSDGAGQTDLRITGTGPIASGITLESTGLSGRTYSWLSTADNTGGGGTGPGRLAAFDVTANAYRMVIDAAGNVGIGNSNPTDRLNVNGNVSFFLASAGATQVCQNASFQISTCSSSIRYKQNVNPFNQGLSLIKQLHPVSFNWRANNQADLGLVAEDVAKVEPLLTTTNDKGEVEGVKYDRIGVVLVNAVQEQQLQIESQQKQIDEQKKLIEKLKGLVCSQNPTGELCKPNK